MAQYNDLIAGLTVGSYGNGNGTLAGFTQLWTGTNESNRSYAVATDVDSPSGKKLTSTISASIRTLLGIDSISADAGRTTIEVLALVRSDLAQSGSATLGHGFAFHGAGAQASETANALGLGRNGSGTHVNRRQLYGSGSATTSSNSSSIASVTGGGSPLPYWVKINVTATTWRIACYALEDLDGTEVGAHAGTHSLADGVVGLFGFIGGTYMDYLYVSAGTGADSAPRPSASVTPVSFSGSINDQAFTAGDVVDVDLTSGFSGTETPFTYANTGTSLAGSGLTINSSGHLVGTAAESSISGVVIAATDTATNTASSNTFNVTVTAAGTDLSIDTMFDLSNISSVSSIVTGASTSEPVVFLAPRTETMTPDGNWRNLIGKVTGCAGKRPIFRFDRTTQDSTSTTRNTLYRICWTADFVTFNQFPLADVSSGISGYYQVQAPSAFTDNVVYVMTNPMYPRAQSDAFATSLLTTYSSVASPTTYAVAAKIANPSWPTGAVFVTDATNDYPTEAGEAMSGVNLGALPIYGFKLDWGTSQGATTDGGPKRNAVLTYGQHAQGEAQASVSYFGALTWLLTSSDIQAVNLRRNFVFYVYFNINGSGIAGGHRRLSYGTGASNTNRSQDFNRVWDQGTPTVPEVRYTRDAILSDTGGTASVLIDWHGTRSSIGDYNTIESSVYDVANNTTWNTLAATHFNMTNADISTVTDADGYIINWANTALNVNYATHAEHANRGNNSKSNLELVGQNWLRTLQSADADGMFYEATSTTVNIAYDIGQVIFAVSSNLTVPVISSTVSYDIGQIEWTVSAQATADGNVASIAYDVGAITYAASIDVSVPVITATIGYDIGSVTYAVSATVAPPAIESAISYDIGAIAYAVSVNVAAAPSDIDLTVSYDIGAASYNVAIISQGVGSLYGVGSGVSFIEPLRGVSFS